MAKSVRSEAKQRSDQLRNIRRRFEREAVRFEKRAANSEGRDRQQLLRAAENSRKEAERFYADNIKGKAKTGSKEYTEAITGAVSRGQSVSLRTLERNNRTTVARKNAVARALLRGNSGSQFYAATRDLWNQDGVSSNGDERNRLIIEKFVDARKTIEKQAFAMDDAGDMRYDFENLTLLDVIDILSEMTGMDFSQNKDEGKRGSQYQVNSRMGLMRIGQMIRTGE